MRTRCTSPTLELPWSPELGVPTAQPGKPQLRKGTQGLAHEDSAAMGTLCLSFLIYPPELACTMQAHVPLWMWEAPVVSTPSGRQQPPFIWRRPGLSGGYKQTGYEAQSCRLMLSPIFWPLRSCVSSSRHPLNQHQVLGKH